MDLSLGNPSNPLLKALRPNTIWQGVPQLCGREFHNYTLGSHFYNQQEQRQRVSYTLAAWRGALGQQETSRPVLSSISFLVQSGLERPFGQFSRQARDLCN